jgi:hypothetical protein
LNWFVLIKIYNHSTNGYNTPSNRRDAEPLG